MRQTFYFVCELTLMPQCCLPTKAAYQEVFQTQALKGSYYKGVQDILKQPGSHR